MREETYQNWRSSPWCLYRDFTQLPALHTNRVSFQSPYSSACGGSETLQDANLKGLAFSDLLRRKALLRGLLRINVWLPEGTKCSLQSLSTSPIFLSGLTFHRDLTVCSEGGSNSHLLVSFCQEGAAPSAQAGQAIAQVPHPIIRTHAHRIIYRIDKWQRNWVTWL